MAVPFVEDWDVVQILGEGAYGEYESSISAAHYTLRLKTRYAKCFCNFADSLIITVLFLCFFLLRLQGEAARQQAVGGGGGSESHRHLSGKRMCRQCQERGLRAQGMSVTVWWLLSDYPKDKTKQNNNNH